MLKVRYWEHGYAILEYSNHETLQILSKLILQVGVLAQRYQRWRINLDSICKVSPCPQPYGLTPLHYIVHTARVSQIPVDNTSRTIPQQGWRSKVANHSIIIYMLLNLKCINQGLLIQLNYIKYIAKVLSLV
jgi:hypothetical protein